jgi:hypothetical protein
VSRKLDLPPIQLTEWRAGADGDNPSRPTNPHYTKWTVHEDSTRKSPIGWKHPTTPYRHLGNVQDMLGNSKDALKTAHDTANKLAIHLGRKRVSPAGVRLLNTLVLTAKVKYGMILSNCSTADINATQRSTKAMMARKHGLRSTTPDAALYGEADSLQWARWGDTCQIERIKLVLQSMDLNTNVGRVIRGAIYRLQQCNGSSQPVLECNDSNQMNTAKASTQWLYQVWHWMAENNVQIRHNRPDETPPRENDYRLMDRARNPSERRAIATMLPRYTWASDVIAEHKGRRTEATPPPANASADWAATAHRICAIGTHTPDDRKLGKWISLGASTAQTRKCLRNQWFTMDDCLYKVIPGQRLPVARKYTKRTFKVGKSTRRVTWLPSNEKSIAPWPNAEPCEARWHGAAPRPEPVQEWLHIHTLPCDECSKSMNKSERVRRLSEHQDPTTSNACYGCNATLCEEHAQATDSRMHGRWICPRCRAQQAAATRPEDARDSSGFTTHNPQKPLAPDEQSPATAEPAQASRDKATPSTECSAMPQSVPENCIRLYSDGSHRYRDQTGTYAWEAGYYEGGLWLQIAKGGGKCSEKDNPNVQLTSTRMEALGVLRGRQWIEKIEWNGKVAVWLDNQSTVTRFAKHQTERYKKCWKKADNDIWAAMRKIDPKQTTLNWVEGHPEKRKAPWQYDEHEKRNVACDKAAEEQYSNKETDRPWTEHPGKICIDNLPIASKIKDTLARHARTRVTAEMFKKRCEAGGKHTLLDMGIMKAIRAAESKAGMLTKCLRITHVLWATNNYLLARGKHDTGKCPLCDSDEEDSNHLKAHCPDQCVTEIRNQMVSDIADDIEAALGNKLPTEAWTEMTKLWTIETLKKAHSEKRTQTKRPTCLTCQKHSNCPHRGLNEKHLPARDNPPHTNTPTTEDKWDENEDSEPLTSENEWDLSEDSEPPTTEDEWEEQELPTLTPEVRACLNDMKAPGARTHWAGWFPTSFANLLATCGISNDEAYELALKIRNRIMTSFDNMWRERNNTKHQPNLRKETDEQIRHTYDRKIQLGMDMGVHDNVESLIKLPHRTKVEWLKHNTKNIETKLKKDREKKIAMEEWTAGQLRWNPETDISTAGSSRPPQKPKHKASKPKDITSVNTMKWNPNAPTKTPGTRKTTKNKSKGKPQRKGALATGESTRTHSTPWATNPQPEAPQGGASSAAAAPPPSTSHIALPRSTDLARSTNSSQQTDTGRAGNTSPQAPTRHAPSSSTERSHSLPPQTPLQADDPDIQHIDRFI